MYARPIAVVVSMISLAVCIGFASTHNPRTPAPPTDAQPLCGLEQLQYFVGDPQFSLEQQVQAARAYKLEQSSLQP